MAAYRVWKLEFIARSLLLGVAALAPLAPATAATPTLMWTAVKRVNILCNVAGGPGIDHVTTSAQLCRDVQRIAARGAPYPVTIIAPGDPTILAGDAVTLLVHGSVTRVRGEALLAFSIRPYRNMAESSSVLFGAAPRAAPLGRSGDRASLDNTIVAALAETLPWAASRSRQPLIIRN